MTLRPSLQPPQPADGGPPVVPARAPRVVGAIGLLPTALAVIAEAAWVAIVAGLLQAFTRHPPVLGYPWFLAAAVAGLVAARVLEAAGGRQLAGRRRRPRDPDRRARLARCARGPRDPRRRRARRPRPGDRRQHRRLAARRRVRPRRRVRTPARRPAPDRQRPRPRGPGPRGGRDHRRHGGGAVPRRVPRRGAGARSSCSSSRRSPRSPCRGSGSSRPGRPSTGAATRPGSRCSSSCSRSRRSWRSPRRCSRATRS